MHLSHPETIPYPLVRGKTVFHETGPWCQKGWVALSYGLTLDTAWRWSQSPQGWPQPHKAAATLTTSGASHKSS